jgi:hypothetical protein
MGWNIVLTIGVLLAGTGAFLGAREHVWLSQARKTTGTVVESVPVHGGKGLTYRPRIQFTAEDGSPHAFLRSYASSPPDFTVGETVTVAYDARSHDGRIVTFGQRFGFAAFLVAMGTAFLSLAILFIVGRQMVPGIYLD